LIFGFIWFRKTEAPPGSDFLWFSGLTAGSRLILEAFRGDSMLVFGGIRAAQIFAWIILAAVIIASELLRAGRKAN
jgi:prolipoprotein diacylglyceryltransferase